MLQSARDQSKVISWDSETGGLYQVEAADSLTDSGAQGLQWIVRETDWPSKGEKSQWMDVGDSRWIPRILHPIFQPQRFYRVTKTGQATLPPPTVTIQLSQGYVPLPDGTNTVSGDLEVAVSVSITDTNQELSTVGVFVDGQRIYNVPSDDFMVSLNTSEWPNGQHEIYAIATTIDGADALAQNESEPTNCANVGIGTASSYVLFDNYISQFFVAVPYFNPASGQTQQVLATFPEDTYWRLTVLNNYDSPVRQINGQSSTLYAEWDGNDDSGNPLPDGYYDYYVEARPSQYGPLGRRGIVCPHSGVALIRFGWFLPNLVEPCPIWAQMGSGAVFPSVVVWLDPWKFSTPRNLQENRGFYLEKYFDVLAVQPALRCKHQRTNHATARALRRARLAPA